MYYLYYCNIINSIIKIFIEIKYTQIKKARSAIKNNSQIKKARTDEKSAKHNMELLSAIKNNSHMKKTNEVIKNKCNIHITHNNCLY